MKLLLWVAIGFAVVWLLRNKKTRPDAGAVPHCRTEPGNAQIETMIRCMQCGVHVPASEAVRNVSGEAFCSEEHRQKHFSS